MVAVFTSNFLKSESALVAYAEQKINEGSMGELSLTFLAILVVVGLFAAVGRIFTADIVESYISNVLSEVPRTIYFFGSSVTGVMLAIFLFISNNGGQSEAQLGHVALLAVIFAVMPFLYGSLLSFAFKRKTHILAKAAEETGEPQAQEA